MSVRHNSQSGHFCDHGSPLILLLLVVCMKNLHESTYSVPIIVVVQYIFWHFVFFIHLSSSLLSVAEIPGIEPGSKGSKPLCYPLHHIPFVFTDMSVCAADLCTSPVATKLGLTAMTIPPEQLLWHVFPPSQSVYTVLVNKC